MYFPALDNYGFACGVCHILGTTVTPHQMRDVCLEIKVTRGPAVKALRGDLLLFTEQKGEHIGCAKKHNIAIMGVGHPGQPEAYGFFDDHCKLYALEVEHRDRVLMIVDKNSDGRHYLN